MNMLQQFKAAYRVSTPLVAIQTPDPAATIHGIAHDMAQAIGDESKLPPMVQWDAVRGLKELNQSGADALAKATSDLEAGQDIVGALEIALKLSPRTIVFVHNAQRLLDSLIVIQAIWNLRDEFKSNFRTLVLLCPAIKLPPELQNDVLVLDEPLPEANELQVIIQDAYSSVEMEAPAETVSKAVDAVAGLAAFPAEQVVAMSFLMDGLDIGALWERKRQVIEQTPGLNVWRGGENFSDIGGVGNIKHFLSRVIKGTVPPRAIVFIDEIEKALAGASGGDTSGVAQDQLGALLAWMQDNSAAGIICIGPPGTAKSQIAKATGNEANVPTIALDLGAMKGSLVGESEERLRTALKVVKAMAQDRVLFIATCNSIGVLPPELRRRFTFGTFFFDLPNAEERAQIWTMYIAKYNLESPQIDFNDEGWTGAEIKQACEIAYRLQCSIDEAAAYIVPVSRSAADQIKQLRSQASGRFISASAPGIYRYQENEADGANGLTGLATGKRRAMNLSVMNFKTNFSRSVFYVPRGNR